jgi:hypothetical protein
MAGSELLVFNPRSRRRRKAKATRRRKSTHRRRHHAVARLNPRRRVRRRGHRRVNSRRRRSHVRHNPRVLGVDLKQITMIAAGGIVTEVLADKLAKMLPAAWATNADIVRIGTKAAVGIGLPMVARKFLPRGWGNAIAIGGGVVTLLDIIKTYVAPHVPGLSLSGYEIGPTGTGIANTTYGFSSYTQDAGLSGSPYDQGVWGNTA